MSVENAIIKKVVTLKPEQTVESAVKLFEKKKLRSAPVIDKDDKLIGYFSLQHLMKNLLPVSVTLDSGLQMPVGAAPGIEKRLQKLHPEPVMALMERNFISVSLETPFWEIVNLLIKHRRALPVVDPATGIFIGELTELSVLAALDKDV